MIVSLPRFPNAPVAGRLNAAVLKKRFAVCAEPGQFDGLSVDVVRTDQDTACSGADARRITGHIDRERESGLHRKNSRELDIAKNGRGHSHFLAHRQVV